MRARVQAASRAFGYEAPSDGDPDGEFRFIARCAIGLPPQPTPFGGARNHESLGNVTPAHADFGRAADILSGPPSNARPSNIGACNTAKSPPKYQPQMRITLRCFC